MEKPFIHMMYFPWDKAQRLKVDEEDFDHAPVDAMRAYAPDFEVKIWTYSRVMNMCREKYPQVWQALQDVIRPVMMVDVLRWVVVHHFGGIYWQINTTPLVAMNEYLPGSGRDTRLFTEFDLAPEQCQAAVSRPIRNGEPEESKRVLIQVFSARAGSAFVGRVIDFLAERVRKNIPREDYDILFITGNAAVSTAYDRFGKQDESVELMNLTESRRMIKWHYRGTWRTDAVKSVKTEPSRSVESRRPVPSRIMTALAPVYYRYFARHSHEVHASKLAVSTGRASFLPLLIEWISSKKVSSVCEFPSGIPPESLPGEQLQYIGADPDRTVTARRQLLVRNGTIKYRAKYIHTNLLYARIPRVELLICADYLERLSHLEIMRIIKRISDGRIVYLALTHHPLLGENWETALGDYRPLNFVIAPYSFPAPVYSAACPSGRGRPDRQLSVWNTASLRFMAGKTGADILES